MNMWKKKITTMFIVRNLILMQINNSYYMCNLFWTTTGGTALIASKTPTNVISSVIVDHSSDLISRASVQQNSSLSGIITGGSNA